MSELFHPLVARKAQRHKLYVDPLVLDVEGRVIARVVDLSESGALIFTKQSLKVGDLVSGWLDSPELFGKDETFVAIEMVVRWVEPEEHQGWIRAGCEFNYAKNDVTEGERLEKIISLLQRD